MNEQAAPANPANEPEEAPRFSLPLWGMGVWLLVVGALHLTPLYSNDVWWHLALGRYAVGHLSLPATDVFSWSFAGKPLSFLPWLPSVLMYLVFVAFGVVGLVWLKGLVASAWLWLSLRYNRGKETPLLWVGLVFPFAFLLVCSRLTLMRSLVFAFLLFPILTMLLDHLRQEKPGRRHLVLVLLILVWVNSHGSYALALAWIALSLCWPMLWDKEVRKERFVLLALLGLGLFATTLLSPTSWTAYRAIFEHAQAHKSADVFGLNAEAIGLSWSRLIGLRSPMLALMLLSLPPLVALSWRRFGHEKIMWALCLLLPFRQQRFVGYVGLFALLFLPHWFAVLQRESSENKLSALAWRGTQGVLFAVICAAPFWSIWYSMNPRHAPLLPTTFGFYVEHRKFPQAAVDYIKKHKPQGRLYNEPFKGGYLMWYMPTHKVFLDSRTVTLYDEGFFHQNFGRHYYGKAHVKETLNHWKIELALVQPGPIATQLFQDKGWQAVSFDDVGVLFLRVGGKNEALRHKTGYQYLQMAPTLRQTVRWMQRLKKRAPQAFVALGGELKRALQLTRYKPKKLSLMAHYYALVAKQR